MSVPSQPLPLRTSHAFQPYKCWLCKNRHFLHSWRDPRGNAYKFLPSLSQELCRKRWLLGTFQQGMSSGGLHPCIPPARIVRAQPMNTEEADRNSTWDSGSSEQTEKCQVNMKTTTRKVFQWFEGKKKATNDEERGQACDTVSERTEYIVTREPNAAKTTAKWWTKTQQLK